MSKGPRATPKPAPKSQRTTYSIEFLTSAANDLDRGNQLHKGVNQPRNSFLDAVRVEMRRQGVPFEKAWDFLKESEPAYFVRHIFAMTDPVGGRGW